MIPSLSVDVSSKEWGSVFLRNDGTHLPDYTKVSYPRRRRYDSLQSQELAKKKQHFPRPGRYPIVCERKCKDTKVVPLLSQETLDLR